MTKRAAHILFAFGDIAVIAIVIWLQGRYSHIFDGIHNGEKLITFNNKLFLALGFLMLPIIHATSIVEAKISKKYKQSFLKYANVTIVVLLVIFLIVPFVMNNQIKSRLESAGYSYCDKLSKQRTISSTLVYVKNSNLCEIPPTASKL